MKNTSQLTSDLCSDMEEDIIKKGFRESFKPLEWNANYLIGNKGRVFSLKSMRCVGNVDSQGYWNVSIDGKRYGVHRLVYSTWVGEIPPDKVVNHESGDKLLNRPANFTLLSRGDNVRHACKVLGKTRTGRLHYRWAGFWVIKDNIFETLTTASKETGISIHTIRSRCKQGIMGYRFIPADRSKSN